MFFLKLPREARFSNKTILFFMLPIILEQFLVAGMTIADTMMVSMLQNSQEAIAGIANVSSFDLLVKQVFIAIAAGGSVVIAQYIGANDWKNSNKSLKMSVYSIFGVTLVLSALIMVFKTQILNLLFGKSAPEIMKQSLKYFTVRIYSYPFMLFYNTCTASFRAIGESRIQFVSSFAMLSINLILKYFFIFHFDMCVTGAGLSLLIAYATVGIILFILLKNPANRANLENIFKPEWDWKIVGKIFNEGIPAGVENGLFQFGALLLQGLVVSLGTASIDAHHLAKTLTALMY